MKKERLIGLEYEFLAIQLANGQAITRDHIKAIWRDWATDKQVTLYHDFGTGQPVGVVYKDRDGQDVIVNTDAGVDVVEFGFMPQSTLTECYDNMYLILREFLTVAQRHGVGLLAYGLQPKTPHFYPDLKTEKIWYRGFARLPHIAGGHSLVHNIAAHQPCIDVRYDELIPALNTLNAISGVTIALFANTGWGEWRKQCCHEEREHRWNRWFNWPDPLIKKIAGVPPLPFHHLRDYLAYNWSIALPAVHREPTLHIVEPAPTIEEFLRRPKWAAFDVGATVPSEILPTIHDVNTLNQYIWIQSRPKFIFAEDIKLTALLYAYDRGSQELDEFVRARLTKLYIETRNIACQPWNEVMAAPAFVLGLIENLELAWALVQEKPWQFWIDLRARTIKDSLNVEEAASIAQRLVEIAEEGDGQGIDGFIAERLITP